MVAGWLALAAVSCSGPPRFTTQNADYARESYDGGDATGFRRLLDICADLAGTRYRYGGDDGRGFDCSGLVGHVYREYNGMKLPRTVREMFRIGRPVDGDRFRTGDLLFFNTDGRGPSHVGIYLGNSTFLHASSSDGVEITDIDDAYYARRYLGARRLLP